LHKDAAECAKYMNGIKLDDRVIRTDLDVGFSEGRQFGRGKSGGQVRNFELSGCLLCLLFNTRY